MMVSGPGWGRMTAQGWVTGCGSGLQTLTQGTEERPSAWLEQSELVSI